MIRLATLTALLLIAAACGTTAPAPTGPAVPVTMQGAACDVCGMMVREQPAPRGQLAYRDGTHAHACAVGDLRALVETPSPHGAVTDVWVETLPGDFDPSAPAGAPLPWMPAADAWFVVGLERPGTMGRPALSFATSTAAEQAAQRLGGRVVRWTALTATPSHLDPPSRSP